MDSLKEKEETLREYASIGDLDGIKYLLKLGIDINSQNCTNGWTALHWACKRNHTEIIKYLLDQGADKFLKNNVGEIPGQLTFEPQIKPVLGEEELNSISYKSPFEPNYIKNPEFFYSQDKIYNQLDVSINGANKYETENDNRNSEVIIKIRIANSDIKEFVEFNLSKHEYTHLNSFVLACLNYIAQNISSTISIKSSKRSGKYEIVLINLNELIQVLSEQEHISVKEIKVIKLPNTLIVNLKDLNNLQNYQEVEFFVEKILFKQKGEAKLLIKGIKRASNRFKNGFGPNLPTKSVEEVKVSSPIVFKDKEGETNCNRAKCLTRKLSNCAMTKYLGNVVMNASSTNKQPRFYERIGSSNNLVSNSQNQVDEMDEDADLNEQAQVNKMPFPNMEIVNVVPPTPCKIPVKSNGVANSKFPPKIMNNRFFASFNRKKQYNTMTTNKSGQIAENCDLEQNPIWY